MPKSSRKRIKSKKELSKLQKLAYLKYIDRAFAYYLANNNPESEIHQQYLNSANCIHRIIRTPDNTLGTIHCKTRWCRVCSRQKTAKQMNQYLPVLQKYKDSLWFSTLTAKTVKGKELEERVKIMDRFWQNIQQNAKRDKIELVGIRKFEINPTHDKKFHPHYHVLLTSEEQAIYIQTKWLKLWKKEFPDKTMAVKKANLYFKIPHDKLIELFKYSTKMVTKNSKEFKDKMQRTVIASPKDYDLIFRTLRRKRTIQPFGGIKPLNQELDESMKINIPEDKRDYIWYYNLKDWISESGEKLTDYNPSKETEEFKAQFK